MASSEIAVNEVDPNEEYPLPPLEVKLGEHRLQYTYAIWYSHRSNRHNYDEKLELLARFNTVESFWSFYGHMSRPYDLATPADIHIFKDGIKPMWEDTANRNGGRWKVKLRRGFASRCWENLLLAILGEQFMVGDEICGAVISVRYQEDKISVWNKTAMDPVIISRIRDTLKRVLGVPPSVLMVYRTHNASLAKINQPAEIRDDRMLL